MGGRMISEFEAIALEIGKVVAEKNISYGDSARTVALAMRAFYPNGVPSEGYEYSLLVVRILDKIGRISQGFVKESFIDIAGYGIKGEAMVRTANQSTPLDTNPPTIESNEVTPDAPIQR